MKAISDANYEMLKAAVDDLTERLLQAQKSYGTASLPVGAIEAKNAVSRVHSATATRATRGMSTSSIAMSTELEHKRAAALAAVTSDAPPDPPRRSMRKSTSSPLLSSAPHSSAASSSALNPDT